MLQYEKHLSWILSFPMMTLIILLGFIPTMFPVLSRYEGRVLPVVKNFEVTEIENHDHGLIINVRFDKVRSCEFIGISWFDSLGKRAPIIFEDDESDLPRTRPQRDEQSSGPWQLVGIYNLDESVAIVSHRCHPLWITYTNFYP